MNSVDWEFDLTHLKTKLKTTLQKYIPLLNSGVNGRSALTGLSFIAKKLLPCEENKQDFHLLKCSAVAALLVLFLTSDQFLMLVFLL